MRHLLMTSCAIAALCGVVQAQTPAQDQQAPPTTTRPSQTPPPARPGQSAPAVGVPTPAAPAAPGQRPTTPPSTVSPSVPHQAAPASTWQNIKLDLTITDAVSASTQLQKVLSLYIADGRQGQVRSQSEQGLINVDARPQVRPDGKSILLQLTVEYRQGASGSQFSESLSALVADGKPIVLSQAADPTGDRKVSVEVLATIQKN